MKKKIKKKMKKKKMKKKMVMKTNKGDHLQNIVVNCICLNKNLLNNEPVIAYFIKNYRMKVNEQLWQILPLNCILAHLPD